MPVPSWDLHRTPHTPAGVNTGALATCFNNVTLLQWFPKCGPWTSDSSLPRELVRNAVSVHTPD